MGEACSMNEERENFIQTLVGERDRYSVRVELGAPNYFYGGA
jgi:hypothetical protein